MTLRLYASINILALEPSAQICREAVRPEGKGINPGVGYIEAESPYL